MTNLTNHIQKWPMTKSINVLIRYVKSMTKNLHRPSYDQPRMAKPHPNDDQPMTKCFLDQSCDQFHAMTNPMTNYMGIVGSQNIPLANPVTNVMLLL